MMKKINNYSPFFNILTYLRMLRFLKMVFVQPALKSDCSPSVNITLRTGKPKIIALVWMLSWGGAYAFANTTADDLQTKLNAIRTMSASFSQVVKAKKRSLSQSSGTMALARPGRFRWDTVSPMSQLVVADGKKLWVYDKELEQVSVKKQSLGMGGAAALFLSGKNDTLKRDFDVEIEKVGQTSKFDLYAKFNKANFVRVKLQFERDELIEMVLFDQLGQETEVHFSHIKNNPKLALSLFQFKIPKGVDVVQQ